MKMTNGVMNRANVEWVEIGKVLPNPLNPRKDDSVKTEEMQDIIMRRGWEEPLTVYQKGKSYVLLAGHRRYYAANQAGVKEVPVYIVDTPKDHQEEIERIASLQSGRVDWTAYEWAKFTYERWIAWGKPSLTQFAKNINLPETRVMTSVQVMDYFSHFEVEHRIKNKSTNMSILHGIVNWINKLKKQKPEIVEKLSEEMIKKYMTNKADRRLLDEKLLRTDKFVAVAKEEDVTSFIISNDMTIAEAQQMYGLNENIKKTWTAFKVRITKLTNDLPELPINDQKQKEYTTEYLKSLISAANKKLREINKIEF